MNPTDEYVATPTVPVHEDESLVEKAQKTEPSLGRVIDVPLTVMLRFGERKMRLQDVLALKTGSLVSLDRHVEEPVELLLGERLLARGEVVIVDGNYGLRVTEVVETPSVAEL